MPGHHSYLILEPLGALASGLLLVFSAAAGLPRS